MKVIVKYFGNLDGVRAISESVHVSELLSQYAVVDIDINLLDKLRQVPEVIYIEEPKRVYPTGEINYVTEADKTENQNDLKSMQNQLTRNGLSGKGVLVGIVDSGDCVKKNNECVKYRAAAYVRISRSDKAEYGYYSNSIYSQKKIINDYINKRDDILISNFYMDDGYSGQNFERPGFKRMIYDIEKGRINCIIVKDLSRIGRDYIEVGRLLKYYLKNMSVCFISIADDFDSDNENEKFKSDLFIQMKSIVNDEYSRDISLKVKSHLQIHMKKGNYVGAFAPYGYRKSLANKRNLIRDDNVTEIIRKIFILRSRGYSLQSIADYLNEKKVLTPLEYRIKINDRYKTPFNSERIGDKTEKKQWYPQMVKRILTNEIYAGILSQGKNKKINYKVNKSIKTEKKQWIRCEKKELAIIDEQLFKNVNKNEVGNGCEKI